MRDRLIKILLQKMFSDQFKNTAQQQAENLADHLLANGVIVPPVNIGQTVWFMSGVLEEVCEAKVIRISMNFYTDPMLWFDFEYFSKQIGAQTQNGRIDLFLGKTVFLTREDAEKALAERSNDGKS